MRRNKFKTRQKYSFLILMICFSSVIYGQKGYKRIKSNKIFTKNNQVLSKDSIPLNGHYRIKHTKSRYELSYFENGFRQGISKELYRKTVEQKGIYLNGLKHGVWENYSLGITSEYKNGKKDGKEFGNTFELGRFICNYSNDSIDGLLLKYNYQDSLDSKQYYKKGQIKSILKYDDSLNVIETSNFTYDNDILIENRRITEKGIVKIDSIFYENYVINPYSKNRGIPFKIIKYENQQKTAKLEVLNLKDPSRENYRKFSINYYDKNGEKTEMYIFYNDLLYSHSIPYIQEDILMRNDINKIDPEGFYFILTLYGFTNINIYVDFPHTETLYTVKYYEENNENMFEYYSLVEMHKLAPLRSTY